MGWDIENPGMYAVANVVSALTNVPLDRLITKINNLKGAVDVDNANWQRIAQFMGYNRCDLGMGKPEDIVELLFKGNYSPKDIMTYENLKALLESPSFKFPDKVAEIIEEFKNKIIINKLPLPNELV